MPKAPLLMMLLSTLLAACGFAPATKTPMPYLQAQVERQSDTLLVMLPGRKEGMESFPNHGFFATGSELGIDMLAADAHFGYYRERTFVQRLHEDIILPARQQGYQQIWLLGLSMGGFGAVLYCNEHSEMIDGLVLLAAYPGESELVQEIQAAGGLSQWPNTGQAGKDFERDVWQWLKMATGARASGPHIIVAYGEDDRFATANGLLAQRLPPTQVFTRPGGHQWDVWQALWQDLVNAGLPIASSPTATAQPLAAASHPNRTANAHTHTHQEKQR